jgi:hypothetical protein
VRPRVTLIAILVAAAALVATGVYWTRRHDDTPAAKTPVLRPLAVIPPGPALVVSVDMQRLRTTHSGQLLVGKGLAALAGEACENELASSVDELVVAMPAGDAVGEANSDALALVADGRFLSAKVIACATARIVAHGGDAVKTTLGSFTSVRDRRRTGELAARDGFLIVSDGLYLRNLIDSADVKRADGTPAERERDALHAELRRVVGRGAPIIATLVLPDGWLGRTLADPSADLSPLAAIRSAALRADVTDHVEIAGLVGTDGSDAGERLERFFTNARSDLTTLFPGSAELFARVHVARHDARLEFDARLTDADLAAFSAQRDGGAGAAPPQSQAPKPEPSGKHD